MSYDVDTPKKLNTELNRDYFSKYRHIQTSDKRSILSHWSMLKGDDSDMVAKTGSGLVLGSIAGVVASIHANVCHTKGPISLVSIAAITSRHGTPWVVAGASYGIALGLVTHLRGKESPVNHMIAGYTAGTIFGSWYKWPMMGVWSGGLLAVGAGFMKYLHDSDVLEEMPLRKQRLFNSYRQNWFMDRPDAEGYDDAKVDVAFRKYKP